MSAEYGTNNAHWQPSASREAAVARQALYASIRTFMNERGVLEVETPAIAATCATDFHLDALKALGRSEGWLQTSPEFHMKRLVAAGFGDIFQICKSFRDGEEGIRHNPEFSMLEWYRPGQDFQECIHETAELVCAVSSVTIGQQKTYRDCFLESLAVDPFLLKTKQLEELGAEQGLPEGLTESEILDGLFSLVIEPELGLNGTLDIVTHYPASQASLSKTGVDKHENAICFRFEGFINGMEIFNGYDELLDADEQLSRFIADIELRKGSKPKPELSPDYRLVNALRQPIAKCCGVALGLDRLLMCQYDTRDIADVLHFPYSRA